MIVTTDTGLCPSCDRPVRARTGTVFMAGSLGGALGLDGGVSRWHSPCETCETGCVEREEDDTPGHRESWHGPCCRPACPSRQRHDSLGQRPGLRCRCEGERVANREDSHEMMPGRRDGYCSVREAAERLGISESRVRRMVERGERRGGLPHRRTLTGGILIPARALERVA